MTKKNTNCLRGYACPVCASLGPFSVESQLLMIWEDDGVADMDDLGSVEMLPGGVWICRECGHNAKQNDFSLTHRPSVPRTLKGFIHMRRGMKHVRITGEGFRAFSLETNQLTLKQWHKLPATWTVMATDQGEDQLWCEMLSHIQEHGTERQRKIFEMDQSREVGAES